VIVFSNGPRGTPDDYRALIGHWVRDGTVVIAPAYPITNRDAAALAAVHSAATSAGGQLDDQFS